MIEKVFESNAELKGQRLDVFLASQLPDYSRSQLQQMIKDGKVLCNGKVMDLPRFALREHSVITVQLEEKVEVEALEAEDFNYEILFEDDSILVINKPAGAVVHPGAGNHTGTIVNELMSRYPAWREIYSDENVRPGIVHRLDKDTSGCLVIAKNPEIQFKMSKIFAERSCEKHYFAIVHGVFQKRTGSINTLIGRHPVNRQKMAVVDRNGKIAISEYKVKTSGLVDNVALSQVAVKIMTGRTHQIRVHMAHLKHPVLGDPVYGGAKGVQVARQMLHAHTLRFPHPVTGDDMTFYAPIPADIQAICDRFEPLKKTFPDKISNSVKEEFYDDDDF